MTRKQTEKEGPQVPFLIMYLVFIMGPIGLIFVASRFLDGVDPEPKPRPRPVASRDSGDPAPRVPAPVENLSFLERLRRKVKYGVSSWRGGGGDISYTSASLKERIARKREMYAEKGITHEAYVSMMILDQYDRTYSDSITQALNTMYEGDFDFARSMLQDALLGLDPKHLLARQKLLKALKDLEVATRNFEEAVRLQQMLGETNLDIAKAYARAQVEKGIFTEGQAQDYVKASEKDKEYNGEMFKLQLGLTGDNPNEGMGGIAKVLDGMTDKVISGDFPGVDPNNIPEPSGDSDSDLPAAPTQPEGDPADPESGPDSDSAEF